MSDHEPTYLIFYDGHFHEALRFPTHWIDRDFAFLCAVGQEEGCLPLDEAKRIFREERQQTSLQKVQTSAADRS